MQIITATDQFDRPYIFNALENKWELRTNGAESKQYHSATHTNLYDAENANEEEDLALLHIELIEL